MRTDFFVSAVRADFAFYLLSSLFHGSGGSTQWHIVRFPDPVTSGVACVLPTVPRATSHRRGHPSMVLSSESTRCCSRKE